MSKSNTNDVLFLGGVNGKRKADGKDFYILSFAVPSSRDNCFGMESAQVFTNIETYNDFFNHATPGTYYPFILHYSRGGWDLINYSL